MPKTRLLIDNACYHIYSRGNQKQIIFNDKNDYNFYLGQLKHYKRKFKFLLYGYCLMPNHIHIIGQPTEPKLISKFMQGLQRSYTSYYNKKHNKVGHLWQDRFKIRVILKDQYLLNCIAYVELNPVRAQITNNPKEYLFSSYPERNLGRNYVSKLLDNLLI